MSDTQQPKNPKIANWATGSSDKSLRRALEDAARIEQGRLTQTDDEARTTPAGFSKERYDAVRSERDELDYKEWMDSAGFSGLRRAPEGPGLLTVEERKQAQAEARRARLRRELEEGF